MIILELIERIPIRDCANAQDEVINFIWINSQLLNNRVCIYLDSKDKIEILLLQLFGTKAINYFSITQLL